MKNTPCPFCGSTRVHTAFENGADIDKWGYAACTDCSAQAGSIRTQYETGEDAQWRTDAIAQWNTRFNPDTASDTAT